MAQSDEEKAKAAEQTDLFGELAENDVVVADDAAEKMKDNILNDKGGANYLGIGVHDVVVTSVELVKAGTGTMGIQFNVENEDGQGRHKFWLSEGALPYTIENISRLLVHNATEKNKDAARNHMANVVSAKEVFEIVVTTLEERAKNKAPFVAVLSIREAKDGSTYTDKNGVERPSTESNLLSYRPKETPVQSAVAATGGELIVDGQSLPF